MLINSDTFFSLLQNYRILWIKGRFGGGKSALAYALAVELVRKKIVNHVVSNIQDVLSDNLEDVKLDNLNNINTVVIADEGGLFLKYGKDVEEYLTLLRKLNIILIIPSVLAPSARVRFFSVQRMMNLGIIGLPLWVYRWDLTYGGERTHELFGWWSPSEVYGIYDTKSPPIDDAGISDWLAERKEELRQRTGYKRKSASVRQYAIIEGAEMASGWGAADVALEAAELQENALSLYDSGSYKGRH